MLNNLVFYTDGACSGNPGPGAYAVVELESCDNKLYLSSVVKNFEETTNNRMELMALLHVIKLAANDPDNNYLVYSDSSYAIQSITNWIYGWARNGWVNSKKKQVENLDIMQEIWKYIQFPLKNLTIEKVHGHAGNLGNELADALCSGNKTKYLNLIKKNNINDF